MDTVDTPLNTEPGGAYLTARSLPDAPAGEQAALAPLAELGTKFICLGG